MARKTLEDVVKEGLYDSTRDSPCTAIALVHQVENGLGQKEIFTFPIKEGGQYSHTSIAEMMNGKAATYSQDLPGVQTFGLLFFYGNSQPQNPHPFTVRPDVGQGAMWGTEQPTPMGSRAQSMRQNDEWMGMASGMIRYSNDLIMRHSQMITAENAHNRREIFDAYALVREMVLERTKEQHEMEMTRMRFQRSSEERSKWLGLLPPLLNTIFGKEIVPQGTADTALIEAIADNIDLTQKDSIENLGKLGNILPQEVMGLLMGRLNDVVEKRERERKKAAELIPSSSNPEDDAAGGPPKLNS